MAPVPETYGFDLHPVRSLGRSHSASLAFSYPSSAFICGIAFLFSFLTPYASIPVCLRVFFFFFLFGNRFASVCTEAVSGVMDRAGSHPRSISVPN